MTDSPDRNDARPLQAQIVGDLLDWEVLENPNKQHEELVGEVVLLRLYLGRGFDGRGYPVLTVKRDQLVKMAKAILAELDG